MTRGPLDASAGPAVVGGVSLLPLGPLSSVLGEGAAMLAPQVPSSYGSGLYSASRKHRSERKWKSRRSHCPSGPLWAEVWAGAGVRSEAASGQKP